jgi:hypothetical protein
MSLRTVGSAFSWIKSDADVCWQKTVRRPVCILLADPFVDSRRDFVETLATHRDFKVCTDCFNCFSPLFSPYMSSHRRRLMQAVVMQKQDGRYSNGHSGLVLNSKISVSGVEDSRVGQGQAPAAGTMHLLWDRRVPRADRR